MFCSVNFAVTVINITETADYSVAQIIFQGVFLEQKWKLLSLNSILHPLSTPKTSAKFRHCPDLKGSAKHQLMDEGRRSSS